MHALAALMCLSSAAGGADAWLRNSRRELGCGMLVGLLMHAVAKPVRADEEPAATASAEPSVSGKVSSCMQNVSMGDTAAHLSAV